MYMSDSDKKTIINLAKKPDLTPIIITNVLTLIMTKLTLTVLAGFKNFTKKLILQWFKFIAMLAACATSIATYAAPAEAEISATGTPSSTLSVNQASISPQPSNKSQANNSSNNDSPNNDSPNNDLPKNDSPKNTPQKSTAEQVAYGVIASLVKVNAQGQEIKQPVTPNTQLKTGDIIEYQGNFTNLTQNVVASMQVTLSIPESVVLIQQPKHKAVLASIDGSSFHKMPLKVRINGQMQNLDLARYRALRWTITNLDSKQTANVVYRAKLTF